LFALLRLAAWRRSLDCPFASVRTASERRRLTQWSFSNEVAHLSTSLPRCGVIYCGNNTVGGSVTGEHFYHSGVQSVSNVLAEERIKPDHHIGSARIRGEVDVEA